jgi:hypothetical protein
MAATTIKVPGEVRDELARVAREDFDGATLAQTLSALLEEHTRRRILEEYEQLRAQPDEWASYLGELDEWAEVGADTLRRSGE